MPPGPGERNMRVGIDAHILGKGKGGVETALLGIIRALAELDRENEYLLYVTANHPFRGGILPANFRLRPLPVSNPWIERPFVIPLLYRQDRLDVIHLQRMMPPWGCRRCVLHIHDVLYETQPRFFPVAKRLIFNSISRASVRRAARIVTVTESVRRDILRIYGIAPDRVTVISNGIDSTMFHLPALNSLVAPIGPSRGVKGPYILVLGMLERHKNTHVAIEAFDRFARTHPEFSLVLIGQSRSEARGGYVRELQLQISRSQSPGRVVMPGYVSNEERLAWIQGAWMLVFPGTAEGFGLPPLEAMACGLPVIVAETAVAKEVYGEAALMTKPLDPHSIAQAMHSLVSDETLLRRMIGRGLARAGRFTWAKVAAKLIDVYRDAAERR